MVITPAGGSSRQPALSAVVTVSGQRALLVYAVGDPAAGTLGTVTQTIAAPAPAPAPGGGGFPPFPIFPTFPTFPG